MKSNITSTSAYREIAQDNIRKAQNAHEADCLLEAAGHMKEAITLLLASNRDDLEPTIDVVRVVIRDLEGMAG